MTPAARRLPIFATLVVAAAVATMVWLGVWQLQRARWKEGLLARYAAAQGKPLLDGLPDPAVANPDELAFRRARVRCIAEPKAPNIVQIGGRNTSGQTGYRNIVACGLQSGPAIMLDLGWSQPGKAAVPSFGAWGGDCFGGCAPLLSFAPIGPLIPDPELAARVFKGRPGRPLPLLLVAENAVPPFQPSVPPSIADIPNNHRAYAVQWFLFAGVAGIVYLLALRRRGQ